MSPRRRWHLESEFFSAWPRYVNMSERRRKAAQRLAQLRKSRPGVSPIEIAGRKIATTFWGEAWCRNLESYSDYANRLPRGRTYLRSGSVLDLEIGPGRVRAVVSGSELYDVEVEIKPLPRKRWSGIKKECAGEIDSLIELLRGSISEGVMEIVTRKGEGLFPSPRQIAVRCSCPDWARMCKHVAAALYGVGARLDRAPELLFTLRGVDPAEMVEVAVARPSASRKGVPAKELSAVFGIEIDVAAQGGRGSRRSKAVSRRKKKASGNGKPRRSR